MECTFTSPVKTACSKFVMYCMQCSMSVSAVYSVYIDLLYDEISLTSTSGSNHILPFVYTSSDIFVELQKVIQGAWMCE